MVVKEFYRIREDNIQLYRTYSNLGLQIRKINTDEYYDEAIDVENSQFDYEETTKLINQEGENIDN